MNLILNNLFNYTDNDGIFNYLNNYNVPWKHDLDIDILNLDYHSRYGIRVVSKQVTSLIKIDGLSSQNKDKLAKLIYSRNAIKWQKLWDSNALYDEFNPLDNTNWTETTTTEKSGGDDTETNYGAVEETFEKGEQNNSNNNGAISNTTESKKSAFNSSSYQPDNSIKSDTTAQNNTSKDGARTDKDTTKARTDTSSIIYGSKEETTVHREGNIGITDAPTLIRNFRGLLSWQILDTIYEDINDVLVISLFGDDDATFDDYKIVTNYVLPIASADTLGGVKIGNNLHIDSNGVLSAEAEAGDVQSVNGKTGNVTLNYDDVGAPSLDEFQQIEDDVENNTTEINNLAMNKQDILTAGKNITIVDNVISASGGGGSGYISVPGTLQNYRYINVASYASSCTIEASDVANVQLVIFDVEEYRGKEFEFWSYFDIKNASSYINRFKGCFIDDTINPLENLDKITVPLSHGIFWGCTNQPSTYGIFGKDMKIPCGKYGNDYRYLVNYYTDFGNLGRGTIPSWAKWFVMYTSNALNDSNRDHIHYDLKVFN